MILDKGICTFHELTDISEPGRMPNEQMVAVYQSWYGELDFGSDMAYSTAKREDVAVSARVRVLQNRSISNLMAVTLSDQPDKRFEVIRVYHGTDDNSGQPISDVSLKAVSA